MKSMREWSLCLFFICLTTIFVPDVSGLFVTLESTTKLVNQTFVVLCKDEAGRIVQWQGPKGNTLGSKTRPSVQVSNYGSAMVFTNTVPADEGTYTCSSGNEKKTFNLTIERVPISFMDTAQSQPGVEGRDVTLRCEVRGGNIAWSVDGNNIEENKYPNKFKIIGDGLLIMKVQRSDGKTYICSAFQPSTGMVVDRKIKLQVLHKPVFPLPIYASDEIVYGYINGTVNLTCVVVGDPSPRFKWERSSSGPIIGRVFNESNEVSILQIQVTKKTLGEYKCTAANPYGTLEKFFTLDEGSKPHPPRFIELKGRNSDLLDLGIHRPTQAEVEILPAMKTTGFRVQYKKVKADNWKIVDFNITEDNSYPLQGLNSNTEYIVRAATRNPAGFSDFTNTSIFTTLSHAGCVQLTVPFIFIIVTHCITKYFTVPNSNFLW